MHYGVSLGWTHDVKGTSLLDFGSRDQRQTLIRMMLSHSRLQSAGHFPSWPAELSQYLLLPPVDNTNNVANFLLSVPHISAWHSAFFSAERVGHVMESTQCPVSSVHSSQYSPFSHRMAQLFFTFTYDPSVRLEVSAGSNCMRPGCTSKDAYSQPFACKCSTIAYCSRRCQQLDRQRHQPTCKPCTFD